MVLLLAVIAGTGVALLRGGSILRLADLRFRLVWLVGLCVLAQMYVVYSPPDRLEAERPLHAVLLTGSYVALALVVWANRRIAGMPAIGLGLILNLAVIAANGGFMPITPDSILAVGHHSLDRPMVEGERLPRSKDVLLPAERTRLWYLSDNIVVPPPLSKVFSIGDLIVGLGAFALLQAAIVANEQKQTREEESLDAV